MSKPVPPKEQPKQTTSRPVSSTAASTKQGASTGGPARSEGKAPMPQVSRTKVSEPSAEQIALRAYHIWLERGQSPGSEVENWLEAERQLSR
jgi:Protein of unknown function (DUF2934)